jgi:tungstate transport system substrate-binding protein
MRAMKRFLLALLAATALMPGIPALAADEGGTVYGSGQHGFSLATGSPGELGLLKTLAEAFARQADARMVWIKAGSGQSLNLLRDRKVDMVMVHAPAQVDKAIADGWAAKKTLIGSNEFCLVGPAADPAGIGAARSAAEAYRKVAAAGGPFVSRGDNSGTHQKEMQIWKAAGVEPQGPWYIVTKDFMTASLKRANAERAYFMSDSSTWIMEKGVAPDLAILFRGDRILVNTYHAIVAPPGATAGRDTAERFIDFVASPEGQRIIAEYGRERFGEGLYNDAAYARQFD